MGACADLWQSEVDRIVDQYAMEELSREEASTALIRKGFEPYEAATLLDEAIQ